METLKCIKTRRSIRKFKDKKVPDKLINELIDAARHAPYASKRDLDPKSSQPWEFIIVKNRETLNKFGKIKTDNEISFATCSCAIIVCTDQEKAKSRWIENGNVATENILLTAHDLGLGSVYITGFSPSDKNVERELKKILGINKENIRVITILPIGYPDQKPEPKELRSLGSMIHNEKW